MEEALTRSETESITYEAMVQELRESITQHEPFMNNHIEENTRIKETIQSLTSTFDSYAQLK